MTSLFDRAEELATNALLASLAVAHNATAGGDDGDAQALQRTREGFDTRVDAAAWLAHARELVQEDFATWAVLETDADLALTAVIDEVETFNVPLVAEDGGNAGADLVAHARDRLGLVAGRVADPRDHVRDGVVDRHELSQLPGCLERSDSTLARVGNTHYLLGDSLTNLFGLKRTDVLTGVLADLLVVGAEG